MKKSYHYLTYNKKTLVYYPPNTTEPTMQFYYRKKDNVLTFTKYFTAPPPEGSGTKRQQANLQGWYEYPHRTLYLVVKEECTFEEDEDIDVLLLRGAIRIPTVLEWYRDMQTYDH